MPFMQVWHFQKPISTTLRLKISSEIFLASQNKPYNPKGGRYGGCLGSPKVSKGYIGAPEGQGELQGGPQGSWGHKGDCEVSKWASMGSENGSKKTSWGFKGDKGDILGSQFSGSQRVCLGVPGDQCGCLQCFSIRCISGYIIRYHMFIDKYKLVRFPVDYAFVACRAISCCMLNRAFVSFFEPCDDQPTNNQVIREQVWLFLFRLLQKPSCNANEQQHDLSVCSILACVEVVWFVAQIIS